MKFSHIVIVILVIVAAFGLMGFAPHQDTNPPVPTAEPGLPPVAPPASQAPDYAGFVASAALVIAATAFAKTRLGLTGNTVLYAAFAIVAAVAFYPDIVALLPPVAATWIDKLVYGVVLPFIAATGSYDLSQQLGFLKPKLTSTK